MEIITVVEATGSTAEILHLDEVLLDVCAYKLHEGTDVLGGTGGEEGEEAPSSRVLVLPSRALDGLWEYLVFEPDIRKGLLHFISSISKCSWEPRRVAVLIYWYVGGSFVCG